MTTRIPKTAVYSVVFLLALVLFISFIVFYFSDVDWDTPYLEKPLSVQQLSNFTSDCEREAAKRYLGEGKVLTRNTAYNIYGYCKNKEEELKRQNAERNTYEQQRRVAQKW